MDVNNTNATPPYTNWTTAATNIQDAVDAAVAGDEVVVTNGTYATGGRAFGGGTINRVVVDKPLTLHSVNGPEFTVIQGYRRSSNRDTNSPVRCVWLTGGASLSGFCLTNGSSSTTENAGGGLRCQSSEAVVSNCVIAGNTAVDLFQGIYGHAGGGGAYGGTLNNCTLTGNSVTADNSRGAYGGGAAYCTLNNCTLTGNSVAGGVFEQPSDIRGGGAYGCTLNNCTLTGNSVNSGGSSGAGGGGAADCTLSSCTLIGNIWQGAYGCTLNNCTVTGNDVAAMHCTANNCTLVGNTFGGALNSTLINCILYFNGGQNYGADPGQFTLINYCCTTPQPTNGFGNITNAPLFVDSAWSNLRLQSNSPCINAGNNAYAPADPDLDGNPRIAGGTVDIGAYEFQAPVSTISYAWLQAFSLPINPATDSADPDGDGVDNYHEWLAGTDPTNPFSFPPLLTLIPYGVPPSGIILTWPTNAVGFTLQSTTNLGSTAGWVTNSPAPIVINGQNTVTNPISGPQQFYRLVQ